MVDHVADLGGEMTEREDVSGLDWVGLSACLRHVRRDLGYGGSHVDVERAERRRVSVRSEGRMRGGCY